MYTVVFFFFKQKTAYEMRISDWSSDVCSSDLVTALTAFILLTLPVLDTGNFSPFAPNGWFGPEGASGMGIVGAAASIFFAYVGFDPVSTAAEETKNPQRNEIGRAQV